MVCSALVRAGCHDLWAGHHRPGVGPWALSPRTADVINGDLAKMSDAVFGSPNGRPTMRGGGVGIVGVIVIVLVILWIVGVIKF